MAVASANGVSARWYAEQGWPVLPLHTIRDGRCDCGKECPTPGKHPRTAHGVHDATTDAQQIINWWNTWPTANVGIATGSRAGVAVIDVDPRHGGLDSLAALQPPMPQTRMVETGSGGYHFYFLCRDPLRPTVLGDGVELKADGSYVVAPPSNHHSGSGYTWLNPETDIAPLPTEWRRGGPALNGTGTIAPDQKQWVVELLRTPCAQGQRNTTLTRLAGYFRNVLPEAVARTVLAQWNRDYCDPPLDDAEVVANIAHKYARYAGTSEQAPTWWTSRSLLAAALPEPIWTVERLLPEGLAFLAGRPKRGKSWLALQIAVDVTTGGFSFGVTGRGRAIYIALEDSPRRLQSRLQRMRAAPSDDLLFFNRFAPLNRGGMADLADLIEQHRPMLVIVDTLTRAISAEQDQDKIGEMTDLLGPMQQTALAEHFTLLLIDHHRKPGPDASDMIDDIIGSTAKVAVADAILGFYRRSGEATATLKVSGRDLEEREIAMTWDGLGFRWQVSGDAVSRVQTEQIDRILRYLGQVGEADATAIGDELRLEKSRAYELIAQMEKTELIDARYVTTGSQGRPRKLFRVHLNGRAVPSGYWVEQKTGEE